MSLPVLQCIGNQVLAARRACGESRAALAARSGLSVRFLAQLEGGEANISILRLSEIAAALRVGVGELLGLGANLGTGTGVESRATPDATAAQDVRRWLEGRTTTELAEVRDWLASRFGTSRAPRVALLGLRGAGKSSVGKRLARAMNVPFFELDALIESDAGLSLGQIFELQGESYYRRLERETLVRFLTATPTCVLATGGGLVTESETFALLRRHCTTVWLRAEPELHWQRVVRQGDRRPMRDNPAAMQELRGLLAARGPLYARAHLSVDTSGRTVTQVASEIARSVRRALCSTASSRD